MASIRVNCQIYDFAQTEYIYQLLFFLFDVAFVCRLCVHNLLYLHVVVTDEVMYSWYSCDADM